MKAIKLEQTFFMSLSCEFGESWKQRRSEMLEMRGMLIFPRREKVGPTTTAGGADTKTQPVLNSKLLFDVMRS